MRIVRYHPSVSGTTLTDLQHLSRTAGLDLEMVHLAPVGDIPVPSIVHLRSQHYSAIVGEQDGRYLVMDPGLGGQFLLTGAAIRDERTKRRRIPTTPMAISPRMERGRLNGMPGISSSPWMWGH